MKYTVVINKSEHGYEAHCPVLPGCHSQGDTLEEAIIKHSGLTDDQFIVYPIR